MCFSRRRRPLVVLEYVARDIWSPRAPACAAAPPVIHNTSAHDAWNIVLSDVLLDTEARCSFLPIPRLRGGEAQSLERVSYDIIVSGRVERYQTSLTAAVSKTVVRQFLAEREAVKNWRLTINYEDKRGYRYLTACELAVWELPLQLRSINVRVGAAAVGHARTRFSGCRSTG
jgi:hypothetical protein